MSIYLVAYYFQKPAHSRVRTQRAGWMKQNNNVSWDEQVAITKNLRNRDLTTARIILDMSAQRVVKNGWDNSRTFDELYDYFSTNYPQYTREIMERVNPAYLAARNPAPVEIPTSGTISSS